MPEAESYEYLQTTAAVRAKARAVRDAGRRGALEHFRVHDARLPEVAARVVQVTRAAYPDVRKIPYHGRYRHFDVGGVPRLARFLGEATHASAEAQLRQSTELVITSVLLDAGAGPAWRYTEEDGRSYARSEGLAVASYHLFMAGALSSEKARAADAAGLSSFDAARLGAAFQVSEHNPLTGVEGRAHLLRELGRVVASTPRYFDSAKPRLGDLGVWLFKQARGGELGAGEVLAAVLDALGPIWPGRERVEGRPLGDVWRHRSFGLVPFHKLSQWLSYSLLEPLEAAGVRVVAVEELTGLPEYRNGGLLLDAGALELVEPRQAAALHEVSSDLVIEWRALTVALLDDLAGEVRRQLGASVEELPLARVLEGGTWRAGRAIARELRADGGPPLRIVSDGTVF